MYDTMEDFLNFFIESMKTAMLWPLNTRNRFILALLNSARIVISIVLCYTTAGLLAQAILYPNLKEIGLTVEIATMTSSACYKMIFIVLNKNRFLRIVRYMTDYFKMEYYSEVDAIKIKISDSHWKCKFFSIFYVSYGVLCMIVWSLIPIIERRLYDNDNNNNNNRLNSSNDEISGEYYYNSTTYEQSFVTTTVNGLPLSCWFPFDEKQTPMYEITYFVEFLSLFASIYIYLINDSFFFVSIYLTSVQMKILRKMLTNLYRPDEDDDHDNIGPVENAFIQNRLLPEEGAINRRNNNLDVVERTKKESEEAKLYNYKLKECIVYHGRLVRFMYELERLNSTLILVDILHALISITFVMFTLMTSETLIEWIKMGLFLVISIWHQFLNAEFGELFLDAQRKMLNGLYNIQWFQIGIEERKLIITMMSNSQNIVELNGFKMYVLCRATFVKLMKSLFSYYMVLRQRANKQ